MSDRVPDSTGLPLRAMVMVLLFFGLIFLLVGFQAMNSGTDNSGSDGTPPNMATTTTTPVPRADVRVYGISGDETAAGRIADRLREAGWNVTESVPSAAAGPAPAVEVADAAQAAELAATTVYYGGADGEQAAAEAVGRVIEAPVQPRRPGIVGQPPGVIVLVTG